MSDDWKSEFRNVWERGVAAWKTGRRSARTMFDAKDAAFLAGIGCTTQELFDEMTTFPFGEQDLLDAAATAAAYLLDRPEPRV